MPWRRIIRGSSIALLTLCMVIWAASCFEEVWFDGTIAGSERMLGISCGSLCLATLSGHPSGPGWIEHEPANWSALRQSYKISDYHFAGFAYADRDGRRAHVYIPLWFPTLLSAAITCFLWLKTRSKFIGQGFPVEVGRK
jgi:hypothetical protein